MGARRSEPSVVGLFGMVCPFHDMFAGQAAAITERGRPSPGAADRPAGGLRAAPAAGIGGTFIAPAGRADFPHVEAFDDHLVGARLDAASGAAISEEL